MNEEKYIQERVGNRNPFRVPAGYFDHLADQVMATLPEREPRARRVWLRPLRYAAAAVCVFALGALSWMALSPDTPQLQAEAVQQEVTEETFDEAADYMMIDNYDIYACLSDE